MLIIMMIMITFFMVATCINTAIMTNHDHQCHIRSIELKSQYSPAFRFLR